jgi:hypothetical protein
MRTRWISPQFVTTNRIDAPGYNEVQGDGPEGGRALGIETSATHMEWFFGPKGLKFSEIGCRPPGVRAWDLYAAANDIDIYREWAMAVVHGRPGQRPRAALLRRHHRAAPRSRRPDQPATTGLDQVDQAFGDLDHRRAPAAGRHADPGVEAGYMANAWIRLKHRPTTTSSAACSTVSAQTR